jgi:dipeptidyl aminopeptidase/acylaminoacyl peptidase
MTAPAPTRPTVPYGAWPSPFTPDRLVAGAAAVGEVRADGADVWWSEQRPAEGGRTQLVRRGADGSVHDLFAPVDPAVGGARAWNARTGVLEYGGGAWSVRGGRLVFAEWSDQRLYRVDPGGEPTPITPEPTVARGLRWSEPTWLDDDWLVCVRESHEPAAVATRGEAVHELVAVPLDGSAAGDPDRVHVLVTGPDFVHSPAAGHGRLAWLQWHHPDMPWDATELVVGRVVRDPAGTPVEVAWPVQVAGGPGESVVQPGFTSAGDLVFCTDRTGWWSPWRMPAHALDGDGRDGGTWDVVGARARQEPLLAGGGVPAEIGGPLWVGGLRWWAEVDPGRFVVSVTADGADGLAVVEADGTLSSLAVEVSEVGQGVAGPGPGTGLVVAASPVREPLPYRVVVGPPAAGAGEAVTVDVVALRAQRDLGVDPSWISVPRHVSFPSAGGRTAHALFYPPTNPDVAGPEGERPPLVVTIQGGPTSAARHRLDLAKQFWTSRGLAVVDVNHGGSTGYGRPYRDLLRGGWGVVDVEDAVAAARHLADAGLVDPARLAIRGGSAGGFTTLAALCFHDTFAAGTSLYGVADLSVLAQDTHKFESRYLDGLVGPWPDAADTYAERSPISHTDGFDRPLLVLHGREDAVVPPAQAEVVVAALAERGVPHAYVLFDGEQHGFRRAETLVRALEAELWFYGRVFGFTPADPVAPVPGAQGL